jgi:putative PEP-CTERM system integral membrane protein
MNTPSKPLTRPEILAAGLFWSWNLIFVAFMLLGFAPRLLPELITGAQANIIPFQYLLYGLILSSIPLAAIALGYTLLRRTPARLFALGYVIEGPLMLLFAVRFFVIRQATTAQLLLFAVAGIGMAAFLWALLDPQRKFGGQPAGWLRLFGLTLMVVICLYTSAWITFYALPIIASAWNWLGDVLKDLPGFAAEFGRMIRSLFTENLIWVPFAFLYFILALYTTTLFVLAPVAVPLLSLRAWWNELRQRVNQHGAWLPAGIVALALVACVGAFVFANRQPQKQAFDLLTEPPATLAQAKALASQEPLLRSGLLNAYLAPYRYISSLGEVRHIRDLYLSSFKMTVFQAQAVQSAYESLAHPLLYAPAQEATVSERVSQSALSREPRRAAQLYQRYFDQRIVEGEYDTVIAAARSTWSIDQAEAALLAIDDREVLLTRQEITVQEFGDWAEIELMEVYQNQTGANQEVIYFFNLPESAVLTGLWLGNSPELNDRFAFIVAPRGAAQGVYREQTRVQRDPALLEQIGPRHYRLRVFPIPPLQTIYDENRARTLINEAPPLYLWMTYTVLNTAQGWPLPSLAHKHNIYWDDRTIRTVNCARLEVDADTWLPASIPASTPAEGAAHRVDFPGGQSVIARPAVSLDVPALPAGLRLAVVLDRSRSMQTHAASVEQSLEALAKLDAVIDVYLTASPYRGEDPSVVSLPDLEPQSVFYFGGQNAAELLAQYSQLQAGRVYDAVIVLTDGSGYELGDGTIDVPVPDAPVWLVHLDGEFSLGYDDPTLEALQASGGGVAADIDEALQRLAVWQAARQDSSRTQALVDNWLWITLPADQADEIAAQAPELGGFTPLAARYLILSEMQRAGGKLSDARTLDALHAIAKETSIVTPFSSMIVLVNAQQRQLLELLSKSGDRFEREVEQVGETVPGSDAPLIGVPEPHEWLLILIAAAMLAYYAYTKKLAAQRALIRR